MTDEPMELEDRGNGRFYAPIAGYYKFPHSGRTQHGAARLLQQTTRTLPTARNAKKPLADDD